MFVQFIFDFPLHPTGKRAMLNTGEGWTMNKQTQRSLALAARRAMSAAERASASELICRALAALP